MSYFVCHTMVTLFPSRDAALPLNFPSHHPCFVALHSHPSFMYVPTTEQSQISSDVPESASSDQFDTLKKKWVLPFPSTLLSSFPFFPLLLPPHSILLPSLSLPFSFLPFIHVLYYLSLRRLNHFPQKKVFYEHRAECEDESDAARPDLQRERAATVGTEHNRGHQGVWGVSWVDLREDVREVGVYT